MIPPNIPTPSLERQAYWGLAGWLSAHAFLRNAACEMSGGCAGETWKVLASGALWDSLAFAIFVLPLLFVLRLMLGAAATAAVGYLVPSLLTTATGVASAVHFGWSHRPLEPLHLQFVQDIPYIWQSGLAIAGGATRAVVVLLAPSLMIVMGATMPFLRLPALAPAWLIAGSLPLTAALGTVHSVAPPPPGLPLAISRNHLISFAYSALRPPNSHPHSGLPADEVRSALVNDAAHFSYLSAGYPVAKRNRSFTPSTPRLVEWKPAKFSPNLVVIVMESIRAEEVGACGSELGLTPNMDRIASGGWVWKNFYANGIQTWRAAVSALSGMYTEDWGDGSEMDQSRPSYPVRGLAEILGENGYDTEYWHNSSLNYGNQRALYHNLGYGLLCGREDLQNPGMENYGWGFPDHVLLEMVAERLNAHPPERPLHILALTVSSHHPFENPRPSPSRSPPARRGNRGRVDMVSDYREIVSYLDWSIGEMLSRLSPAVLERTIFVLVGDHGVSLGEDGAPPSLYGRPVDKNFRVPLIVFAPGLDMKPSVLDEVSSHVDLLPTLLDLVGVSGANHAVGRSLLSEPRSQEENMAYFDNGFWRSIRVGDYVYLGESGAFFGEYGQENRGTLHAAADHGRVRDLSESRPTLAAHLHNRIARIASAKQALWKSREFDVWFPERTIPRPPELNASP